MAKQEGNITRERLSWNNSSRRIVDSLVKFSIRSSISVALKAIGNYATVSLIVAIVDGRTDPASLA